MGLSIVSEGILFRHLSTSLILSVLFMYLIANNSRINLLRILRDNVKYL